MSTRNGLSAVVSVSMIAASSAVMVGGLWYSGLVPWADETVADEPEALTATSRVQILQGDRVDAREFVDSLMSSASQRWGGDVVRHAQVPFPFTCAASESPAPVVSASTGSGSVRVSVAVYHAGQGAPEYRSQASRPSKCGGAAWSSSGPGTESRIATATWDGKTSSTLSWRRGDIVLYATIDGRPGTALSSLADEVDAMASASLGTSCLTEDSDVEDAARSPLFAGDAYTPYRVDQEVSIPEIALPPAPEGVSAEFPRPEVDLPEVDLPRQREYPVWPPLPEPVERPSLPEVPERPGTSTTVRVLAPDTHGPGCGWEFTGEAMPPFDRAAAEAERDELVSAARESLETAARKWQESVLAYWEAYDQAAEGIQPYLTYVEQVEGVTEQWAAIDRQWDEYEDQMRAYRSRQAEYREIMAERQRLREEYEAQVEYCSQPVEEPETNDAAPLPEDEVQPTPSPTPSSPPEPREGCPAEVPEMLQQPEPEEPEAPKPPADPRP